MRSPSPTSGGVSRLPPGFPIVPNSMFSHSIMYMSHYMPGMGPLGSRDPALLLSPDERRKRNRTFIDPVTEVPRLEQWSVTFIFQTGEIILKSSGSPSTRILPTTWYWNTRRSWTECRTGKSFPGSSLKTCNFGSKTVGPSANASKCRCLTDHLITHKIKWVKIIDTRIAKLNLTLLCFRYLKSKASHLRASAINIRYSKSLCFVSIYPACWCVY